MEKDAVTGGSAKHHRRAKIGAKRHLFEVGSIHAVEPSVSFTRDTPPPPPCSVSASIDEEGRGETGEDDASMKDMCV